MRRLFRSPRLENVEGVAQMLNAEGIETYISQARSYKGHRRGTFSYLQSARDGEDTWPAVWVVHAEDQPRARQLLRNAGLLSSTRPDATPDVEVRRPTPARTHWMLRVRLLLLAAIVGLSIFIVRQLSTRPAPAPVTVPVIIGSTEQAPETAASLRG